MSSLNWVWLRGKKFDLFLILAPLVLGCLASIICLRWPKLFTLVMWLDLWLLGYHHVISTFTRLAFDRASVYRNRFLVFYLPPIILICTLALAYNMGSWIVVSVYFYWQWFHYTRQSYGISLRYLNGKGDKLDRFAWIHHFSLFGLPIAGLLYRGFQQPHTFLGMKFKSFFVPEIVVDVALVLAVIFLILEIFVWVYRYKKNNLLPAHMIYNSTHHLIFWISYFAIKDISLGWLAINIWHNLQYILFVWHKNNEKYAQEKDQNPTLISWLSQKRNFVYYFGACLIITFLFYGSIKLFLVFYGKINIIPLALILFMTINFHHYIVDGLIWRRGTIHDPKTQSP